MRNVTLVPESDVFECWRHGGADHAGKAGEILGQHRVALVRHRRRALLTGREILLGLQHFGALQVADFDGEALYRRGDDAERGKEHGMAIARDDLCRYRLGPEAKGLSDVDLDARVDVGEGTDGAGYGAGGNFLASGDQAGAAAVEFGIGLGHLQAEGDRFGVDAMAAADADGTLVLHSPALQRGEQAVDIGDENIGGPL